MKTQKTAIVAGASSGIGAAIASHLANIGYAVVVGYKTSSANAKRLCADISAAGGVAKPFRADISLEEEAAALITFSVKEFDRLDLLVNNAGLAEGMPLEEVDLTHIEKIFAVNVRGLLFCCKHAVLKFDGSGGTIINISSVNATSPVPGGAAYSGSKAAVNAITISLAREFGARNVRVNAVAPGVTMTDRYLAEVPGEAKTTIIEKTLLGRLGTPRDIVGLVAYLADDDALGSQVKSSPRAAGRFR